MNDNLSETTKFNAKANAINVGIRLLFAILFCVIFYLSIVVLIAIIVFQFGYMLITGKRNEKINEFSAGMNLYVYDILQYLTYRSDRKPFPFGDWTANDLSSS